MGNKIIKNYLLNYDYYWLSLPLSYCCFIVLAPFSRAFARYRDCTKCFANIYLSLEQY